MPQKLEYLKETPSQTAGPYVHIGLAPGAAGFDIYRQELGWDIAGPNAEGERIRVEGLVVDGTGSPVKDVMLEAWQANATGRHAHPEGGGDVEDGFRDHRNRFLKIRHPVSSRQQRHAIRPDERNRDPRFVDLVLIDVVIQELF